MRYIYGFFRLQKDGRGIYTPCFSLLTNKREAIRFAKIWRGYVGRVPVLPGSNRYDAPTFRALMDLVADFRIEAEKEMEF